MCMCKSGVRPKFRCGIERSAITTTRRTGDKAPAPLIRFFTSGRFGKHFYSLSRHLIRYRLDRLCFTAQKRQFTVIGANIDDIFGYKFKGLQECRYVRSVMQISIFLTIYFYLCNFFYKTF